MKVIITGSSGLLGTSLFNTIKKMINNNENQNANEYYFLTSKDCDLTSAKMTEYVFEILAPEIVVHLASRVGGLYCNMSNNYSMLVDNIKINTNVLEACRKTNVKRLINILSTCVFPDSGISYPLTSDQILNGPPHTSNEGYAYSKRILLTGSELLSKSSGIEVINIIPTNLYGESDNYNLQNSHCIPGIIHKLYLAKNSNSPYFAVQGDGNQYRQFMYIGDLAKIIAKFIDYELKENQKFVTLIASTPQNTEISIKNLVKKIKNLIDYNGEIVYDSSYSGGQEKKTTDSNELLSFFPDFKFTLLDIGLEKTIKYFINNYNLIRK